jgi:Zn ribbon nucleic-acid-binding protein
MERCITGKKYIPLIACEKCKTLTRHEFWRHEKRMFECVEERRGLSVADRKRLEEESIMWALIHKCKDCGTERGYGNLGRSPLSYVI